jgi:hypothetical protein
MVVTGYKFQVENAALNAQSALVENAALNAQSALRFQ